MKLYKQHRITEVVDDCSYQADGARKSINLKRVPYNYVEVVPDKSTGFNPKFSLNGCDILFEVPPAKGVKLIVKYDTHNLVWVKGPFENIIEEVA